MLAVCTYLWDHADACECDTRGKPVKVTLEEFNQSRSYVGLGMSSDFKVAHLRELVEQHFVSSSLLRDAGFVEIEDAANLLTKSTEYTTDDRAFLNEDGTNGIVNDWSLFGDIEGRWIALKMTVNLIDNLTAATSLPLRFDSLLSSTSGKCYLCQVVPRTETHQLRHRSSTCLELE